MKVRTFDWRDLSALRRFRNRFLFMDTTRVLTKGTQLMPFGALFSYLAVATGIFTYQVRDNSNPRNIIIGQVIHNAGSQIARLSFLAPEDAIDSPALPYLLDHMITKIGERGAYHLIAEVDVENCAFEALRKAGFGIYARQRIWQLTGEPVVDPTITPAANIWTRATSKDSINVRSLYCNLVPGLVQQVEPPPVNRPHGLVYREGDDLLGYVELRDGPRGIWAQPFIHPDTENVPGKLAGLLTNLPNRRSRPVYLCVRSYQSWLESAFEDLGAEAGPRQAVMVKRLTASIKAARAIQMPALERGHPEVSAPMTQSKRY